MVEITQNQMLLLIAIIIFSILCIYLYRKYKDIIKKDYEIKLLLIAATIGFIGKYTGIIPEKELISAIFLLIILLSFFELNKYNKIHEKLQKIEDKVIALEDSKLIRNMGLKAINPSSGDDSIFENLDSAYTVDIMANTSRTFFGKYMGKIANAIVNNGCRVRILLSNPENDIWNYECVNEGLCPGLEIKNEIKQVRAIIENRVNILKEYKPPLKAGSIELKMYSNLPTCSITIINNEIARHIPYLPLSHSGEVPNYDVTKKGRLFKEYQDAFKRVWEKPSSETALKIDFGTNQ